MKLKHLHIDSYKVFRDFDIDFCIDESPADIIVIAGVNGTGKTTLLKEMLCPGGEYNTFQTIGSVTYIDELSEDVILSIPSFGYQCKYDIEYFPSNVVMSNLSEFILKYVDRIIYEEGRASTEAYRETQERIELIFKDFDLGTQFYGVDRDRQLIFTNKLGDKFGIDGLSDGEKQVLGKVFPLFTYEKMAKVILMDEPEESLHPAWQSNLVPILRRAARENNCQFILATHSPQIISSVRAEELRLLIRTEDGNIKAVTPSEGPYGWTVEKVLSEIQHVHNLRVPEVEEKLSQLSEMIEKNEYQTDAFFVLWREMEETLGYSDRDLVLMRMEMLRKKKQYEKD